MEHSPGFLKVVDEARQRVREVDIAEARALLDRNPNAVLIDVREDHEWQLGRAANARHLGKGILERDLEKAVPDPTTEIVMYCGGGYRSVLTAEVAGRMGYVNAVSLKGGYKALVAAGWPIEKGP